MLKYKSYFEKGVIVEKRFASDYIRHILSKENLAVSAIFEFIHKNNSLREELNFEHFKQQIKHYCTTPIIPSKGHDMFSHWDVKLFGKKIDVKGLRKVSRFDETPNEEIHWIELKNVQGDEGWLYGEADYFSFEMEKCWVIVEKEVLQNLIAEKCKEKIKSETPELYKLYTRNGRKDILTLVKTIDLVQISTDIVKKKLK